MNQPIYITNPAVIQKADIAGTVALHDHVNATSIEVDGKQYSARTLRYVTFAGQRGADLLYHGEHRFLPAQPDNDLPAADLSQLFKRGEPNGHDDSY